MENVFSSSSLNAHFRETPLDPPESLGVQIRAMTTRHLNGAFLEALELGDQSFGKTRSNVTTNKVNPFCGRSIDGLRRDCAQQKGTTSRQRGIFLLVRALPGDHRNRQVVACQNRTSILSNSRALPAG